MEEKWTFRQLPATGRIVIVAEGYATEEKSKEAAAEFRRLLGSQTVDLVVDLDKMAGYTTGARKAWQEAFYPVKKQLRRMQVIGREVPAMIRMGATVVAAVIGVPISFYKTMTELDEQAPKRDAG